MKRYVVAGLLQALPACFVAYVAAGMLLAADPSRTSSPVGVALIAAASLASAVLGFYAYSHPRARLPFAVIELCWSAIYSLPLVADLAGSAQAASLLSYTGEDPILRITVVVGTAAANAGAEIMRTFCLVMFALHAFCLVLGLWGVVEMLIAKHRDGRVR